MPLDCDFFDPLDDGRPDFRMSLPADDKREVLQPYPALAREFKQPDILVRYATQKRLHGGKRRNGIGSVDDRQHRHPNIGRTNGPAAQSQDTAA